MTTFGIKRWDTFVVNNHRVPAIYFTPTLELMEFFKKNNYVCVAAISGTETVYDGKKMVATVNLSSNVPWPSSRPNFYAETGWWVATLQSSNSGLPAPGSLGRVSFIGLN